MARNLKDAFYNAQYRVGQGLYTRAVSQDAAGSLTQANFESYETFTNLVDDNTVMTEFAGSQLLMEDVSGSSEGMNTVAASQTAMDAVAASQTAMDAVAASQTAMDAVMATLIGRTTLLSSSNIVNSIYSEVTGSEGVWEQFAPSNTIPFTYSNIADVSFDSDTNNGSGSAVVITSTSSASGNTNSNILSTTIDFTSISQLSIRYKDDGTTGGLIIDIDGTNEITQYNTNTYTEFTIDTSGYSGELTLDIGTFTGDGRVVHFDELKFIEA